MTLSQNDIELLDRYTVWSDERTRNGLGAEVDQFKAHLLAEAAPTRLAAVHAKAKEALDARNSFRPDQFNDAAAAAVVLDRMGDAIVHILVHSEPYVPEHERMPRV